MIIRANMQLSKASANGSANKTLADGSIVIRDEQFGDLTIFKVRVVEGKDGLFVTFPQEKYIDKKTQEVKYAKLFQCSRDWQNLIHEAVLTAYSDMKKRPAPDPAVPAGV